MSTELSFVGLNVKRFRKQKHWTQEETAKKADISRIALIHIESGKATPTLETILNLCRVLEVPMHIMLSNYSENGNNSPESMRLETDIALLTQRLRTCSPDQVTAIRRVVENILQSFLNGTSTPASMGSMSNYDNGMPLPHLNKSSLSGQSGAQPSSANLDFDNVYSMQTQAKA